MAIEKTKNFGWFGNTFLFLFITAAGAFILAIPTFIFIFFIWNWATACAVTLWVTAPVSAIYAVIQLWFQRIANEAYNLDVKNIQDYMETNKFTPFKSFESSTGMIAINQDFSQITLCKSGQPPRMISPSDIIELVLEINDSVESKSTSGMGGSLAGAAVGGILTGGTGAIVGAIAGNNGKNTTKSGVTSVAIKLVVKNLPDPLFVLPFLEGETVWERTSMVGKDALKRSNELWALLTVFRDKANL